MTNSTNQFWRFSSRMGFLAALGLFLLAFPNGDTPAAEARRNVHFDHVKTGFPLTGAHVQVPCETCHIHGTFKGTPKNCETCHTPGSRIQTASIKPPNHIPTQQACNQCHSSTASWKVARFTHAGVTPHQCGQCHNNSFAPGKPAMHPATTQPCDTCHRTTTWMSAAFTHLGVLPGSCATCHGSTATRKPSNHVPTNLSCDACHTTGGTFTTSRFTHSATQGVLPLQCATCHNGSYTQWNALGKTPNHVATTASCDTCHTGNASFMMTGSTFNHAGVTPGSCTTCHIQGGSAKTFKPSNHIPTSLSCDACHSTGGTFTTSTFRHSATQSVVAGQCSTCHNGSYTQWNALGKPANHVATTASCDTCHTGYTTFAGAGFNHTGVSPGTCSTCHFQGGPGLAKPANHIPYESQLLAGSSMNCDACHKSTTSFTVQTMNHNSSQGNGSGWCKGCHASGTSYLGSMEKKSLTHQKTTGVTDCSQSDCHRPLGTRGTPYSKW
ncbi:MAG: hypothetical protein HY082_00020 [Gammaproteobacteria bacterium]|nr:hypothetical protein [Gammaproteobacteria bacterium]